jgi:hypothetical protein
MKRFRVSLVDKWVQINDLRVSLDFWFKLNPDFKLPPQDEHYDGGRLWIHWEYIIDPENMDYIHRVTTGRSEKHLPIPDVQCEEWIANYENYKESWEVHQKELRIIPAHVLTTDEIPAHGDGDAYAACTTSSKSEIVSDSKKSKVKR